MLDLSQEALTDAATMSEAMFRRLLIGALGAGFALLVIVAATVAWLVVREQTYAAWVGHTYTVEQQLYDFRVMFERAEAARRGYLLNPDPHYLDVFHDSATGLPQRLESLQALTGDNPRQQQNVARLQDLVAQKLKGLDRSINRARNGDAAGAAADFRADRNVDPISNIRQLTQDMLTEENRLLTERSEGQLQTGRILLLVVFAAGALLVVLGVGALWVVRRYADDLRRSEEALRRLNEGLEQAVRERTADLSRANEEIQRFAYIVSHDLRAPLVNVMGFTSELEVALVSLRDLVNRVEAEAPALLSKPAKEAVDTDLPESIGFIRSSSKKMDSLINAILKLSRAGRRTLTPEPIDMNASVKQIAGNLKHQADQRGAEIVIEGELPEVVSDRLAVEQVFANVIENAVKYLKPGRPGRIVVRGRQTPTRLIYEVEDNGRGIDPKDHDRVFDLFRRSGAQDQPGEGIGLAHVRATVHRLGGTITVDSRLDQGATFRISLPRTLTRDEGLAA